MAKFIVKTKTRLQEYIKGDMLLNNVPWGGQESYQRGVNMTNSFWVKMGKSQKLLVGVNALSHQRLVGER